MEHWLCCSFKLSSIRLSQSRQSTCSREFWLLHTYTHDNPHNSKHCRREALPHVHCPLSSFFSLSSLHPPPPPFSRAPPFILPTFASSFHHLGPRAPLFILPSPFPGPPSPAPPFRPTPSPLPRTTHLYRIIALSTTLTAIIFASFTTSRFHLRVSCKAS
jgi:hypothetical protein